MMSCSRHPESVPPYKSTEKRIDVVEMGNKSVQKGRNGEA